ncbi:uncharacterized protein LOC123869892 isoform X2 [Maniola jurtina]|nr:uncharacterized protein LOC123869892 isoform X2 [Maniola jurtina]
MENHRSLALGKMRGLEGRDESKKLWLKLTRIVNNIMGPTRPMKSWIKYWADKKSTVRSKVVSGGGDPNILCSNIEKKIWDLFLAPKEGTSSKHRVRKNKPRSRSNSVKVEPQFSEVPVFDDDEIDQNHDESALDFDEPALDFDEPVLDFDDRQMIVMEKLVKVMSEQAAAMTQLAHASQVNAQAMERLADASQIQARAVERVASTFESISVATHNVSSALVDIDATLKRFYNTAPT